jgi:hypothetical protein
MAFGEFGHPQVVLGIRHDLIDAGILHFEAAPLAEGEALFRYFAMIAGLNVPIKERGIAAWAASMSYGTRRKST